MSKFYVVGTPIGNLEDITVRALRVLEKVDLIFAEDTRVTRKLLNKYGIKTLVERFDARVEAMSSDRAINVLKNKKDIALVSDAGTPGISDPGGRVVLRIREELPEVEIIAIPGASSLVTALSVSGLKNTEFTFLGFLPHKKGRETLFKEINKSKRTIVFFESPHRVAKALKSLSENLAEKRQITIARELTKIHEEVKTDSAKELLGYFKSNPEKQKGEFVFIVHPG